MFTQLLASRPVRQKSTGGLMASIALHLGLATGIVYATTQVVPVITKDPAVPLAYAPPEPPEHLVPVTTAPPTDVPTDVLTVAPVDVPISLPPLTPTTIPAVDRAVTVGASTVPILGAVPTHVSTPVPTGIYREEQVEVPVALLRNSPKPAYPSSLASTGIAGSARFRFVVGADGRVEMATVEQVDASHGAFAMAVRSTLARLRFSPALVDGRAVRQLVELPFEFRTNR
jgi:protein TonB